MLKFAMRAKRPECQMGPNSDNLIEDNWPSVNWETMHSQAWERCFGSIPDFKSDHFRQIIFVILTLSSRRRNDCTLATILRIVSKRDLLDQKTVASRVERLIDNKLLERVKHPTDKRKQLILPTETLCARLKNYSNLVLKIAHEIVRQTPSVILVDTIDLDLRFDLRDSLDCNNVASSELTGEKKPTEGARD